MLKLNKSFQQHNKVDTVRIHFSLWGKLRYQGIKTGTFNRAIKILRQELLTELFIKILRREILTELL